MENWWHHVNNLIHGVVCMVPLYISRYHQFSMCCKNEMLPKLIYLGIIYLIWWSMVTGGGVAEWLCCLWFDCFSLDGFWFKSHCVQIFIAYFWAPYTKSPPRFWGFLWVFMGFHGFLEVVITSNLGGPVGVVGGLGEVSGGLSGYKGLGPKVELWEGESMGKQSSHLEKDHWLYPQITWSHGKQIRPRLRSIFPWIHTYR